SFMYCAVQGFTFATLVLAANTSYQGFPRLGAVLARDRYFPRQFINLGDRLVYSNGIIVLAAIASFLIWIFHADVLALIHLYVIGVFTAFTLSQAGMVRYWWRRRDPGWRRAAALNATGAVATGLVALLVIQAKFTAGVCARDAGEARGGWGGRAARVAVDPRRFRGREPPLSKGRATRARRCRRGGSSSVADEPGRALRRVCRCGAAGGPLVRPADRG